MGESGSCASPLDITLPYRRPTASPTVPHGDATALSCATASGLGEAALRVTLTAAKTVHVTGNDLSGQGLGVEIRSGSDCTGASKQCIWKSTGVLDEMVDLPAGTFVFVVERNPTGELTFGVE